MRYSFIASVLMISAAIFASAADAKTIPKLIKKSGAYDLARSSLLKSGWKPIGAQLREEGSCDPTIDKRCKTYPEARECSATGLAFCNMVWKHKDGTTIVITTGGEGKAVIVNVAIQS
jgi:hypothetical protein